MQDDSDTTTPERPNRVAGPKTSLRLFPTNGQAYDWGATTSKGPNGTAADRRIVIGGASATTHSPEWHPPPSWVDDIRRQGRAAGVSLFEKSNLLVKERPGGAQYQFTDEAPAFFHYLGKKPPKQPACQCPRRLKVINGLLTSPPRITNSQCQSPKTESGSPPIKPNSCAATPRSESSTERRSKSTNKHAHSMSNGPKSMCITGHASLRYLGDPGVANDNLPSAMRAGD